MASQSSFVVLAGDINGNIQAFFDKLAAYNRKKPVAFAVVAGELFAPPSARTDSNHQNTLEELLEGKLRPPVPCYFALSHHPFPVSVQAKLSSDNEELCENLFFLGKRTTTATSAGLRICALGGTLDTALEQETAKLHPYTPTYSTADVKFLQRNSRLCDILITTEWPAGVTTKTNLPFDGQVPQAHSCIADLCAALKPKYHVSTSGDTFWKSEAFQYEPSMEASRFTRFVSLESFTDQKKGCLKTYLIPSNDPTTRPEGCTEFPLELTGRKRSHPEGMETSYLEYEETSRPYKKPRNGRRKGPLPLDDCFFCVANSSKFETHYIVALGEHSYVVTPKGALPTTNTFPELGFRPHLLIVPHAHSSSLASALVDDREAVYKEMLSLRSSLDCMLLAKANKLYGSVTWELSRSGIAHTHWQYLAIHAEKIQQGDVEAGFQAVASREHYPAFKREDVGMGVDETSDYFRVMIWNPNDPVEQYKSLTMRFDAKDNFDPWFGRRVMASLLKLDRRLNWNKCLLPMEDEKKDVKAVIEALKPFSVHTYVIK